ncbi:MAG TPA: hypothetical protein VGJ79_15550 [Candidatus Dormibacteraeota bacterium]
MDVRDIAAVAAVALTEAGHEGATYTLTGPEGITHSQIAAALTATVGGASRSLTYRRKHSLTASGTFCRPGR